MLLVLNDYQKQYDPKNVKVHNYHIPYDNIHKKLTDNISSFMTGNKSLQELVDILRVAFLSELVRAPVSPSKNK